HAGRSRIATGDFSFHAGCAPARAGPVERHAGAVCRRGVPGICGGHYHWRRYASLGAYDSGSFAKDETRCAQTYGPRLRADAGLVPCRASFANWIHSGLAHDTHATVRSHVVASAPRAKEKLKSMEQCLRSKAEKHRLFK